MLSVVKRLLCLVNVQILRKSAGRGDDDIRLCGDCHLIQFVKQPTARAVRLNIVARHAVADFFVLVKHDVDDEINMDKGAHLVDVDAHGVRIQVARMRALIHHALVVRLDRIVRGNAGHNGLGAAAVAREIMVFNIAQANNPVRLCDRGKDVDRRAVLGYAEVCVVLARIKAGKAAEHLLPRRLPHLFRCHFTMDAQGENNGDILIPHTGERQLLCHMRQHGVTGGAAANALAKEADLVIAVGSRLTDFTTASKWGFQHPDVKLLGVNVCAFDALKMDAQTVIADAKETLSALLPALAETGYQAQWGGRIREVKDAFTAEVDRQYAVDLPEGLSQTRALGEINRAIAQDSIIVGSSGSLPGCLQRLWRPGAKHTYHLEYGFSCMGYEICGALGVKLAEPEKEVYAMVGDGSFLMLHSELYTAVQEGAKINVLLFDNTGWGCIENLQNEQGTETFGTRFTRRNPETGLLDGAVVPIDFAKCAAGYGCKTYTATNVEELRAALADAKRQTVPTLIDIKVVHGSMSHGYDAWWRVGVAEVSASETVQKAYGAMQENIKKARLY